MKYSQEGEEQEFFYMPIKTTPTTFRIGGAGKFSDEHLSLGRTQAMLVYAKLHEWLFLNPELEVKQD